MAKPPFADIGFCIYCDARYYTQDGQEEPHLEHIVPFALNGDLALGRASCRACERVTGRFEAKVLRNHLRGPRHVMGLDSRNEYEDERLPLFVPDVKGERKIMVPIEEFPAALFLPVFPDPPALWDIAGYGPVAYDHPPFVHSFTDIRKTAQTYGIREWSYGSMDTRLFCRMIAKIAHAFAMGTMGPERFEPILPELIRDPDLTSRAILPFIGGQPIKSPSPERRHHLEHTSVEIDGKIYFLVNVRLFANLGAPIYCAVIGTPKGQAMPPLVENPGGVNGLPNYYRVGVRVR
jgi:hypothetical protein